MKINKIENRIVYFLLSFSIFLLNIKNLSLPIIVIGSFLATLFILFFEKVNLYQFKITKIIISIFSFVFLIFYLNKVTYYIGDNILREYSTVIISLTLLLTIFLLGNKGYHTIIKVILLASYFLFFFFLLSFFISIPYFQLDNLTADIFTLKNCFWGSIYYMMLEIYIYFLIFPLSNTKFHVRDILFSSFYQVLTYLFIISILGMTLTNIYKYSYITILKKVNLIGFVERIEIIFSLNYLFCFYFLLVFIFYQFKQILTLYLKKDKPVNTMLIFLFILIFLLSMAIE